MRKQRPPKREELCPQCVRAVTVTFNVLNYETVLAWHGPGPKGEFTCPGTGHAVRPSAAEAAYAESAARQVQQPTQTRKVRRGQQYA